MGVLEGITVDWSRAGLREADLERCGCGRGLTGLVKSSKVTEGGESSLADKYSSGVE